MSEGSASARLEDSKIGLRTVWLGPDAARCMSLKDLIAGFHDGIKGLVLGSVILLLAITIGRISDKPAQQRQI